MIALHLELPQARAIAAVRERASSHPIGHGEIPPGTSQPYYEFTEDGRSLLVRTPFTPRPFDHTLANELGHVVVVTNRGLHTTSSVNSQQNRVTPDWSDIVTRELPGEAIYLHDPQSGEWFSPTYQPLNDASAAHEAEFGVDGSATFRMTRGTLETELTVFVPPDDPAGVYLLTVRNHAESARRLRLAPYFPDSARRSAGVSPARWRSIPSRRQARSSSRTHATLSALGRRSSPYRALSSASRPCGGRFFGRGRGVDRPFMMERGEPDTQRASDDRPVAALA